MFGLGMLWRTAPAESPRSPPTPSPPASAASGEAKGWKKLPDKFEPLSERKELDLALPPTQEVVRQACEEAGHGPASGGTWQGKVHPALLEKALNVGVAEPCEEGNSRPPAMHILGTSSIAESRFATAQWFSTKVPSGLIEMCVRRAMCLGRSAKLAALLKVEADRWIRDRYSAISDELATRWIVVAVARGMQISDDEITLWKSLNHEQANEQMHRASRFWNGEPAVPLEDGLLMRLSRGTFARRIGKNKLWSAKDPQ
ncbi:hypothetical protein 2 [Wuhan spider virus 8]|uniref:hypothetical protein 2 n=1 Tax=Wuhan spider virus 8 TaxID=1923757 RepID=UPI00090B16E6|nr:hypothetical protein 2 [Wuhan spider virus 8]APG76394.1 hypothetical protein 2 [Wuhan spider virus 8]